VGAVASTTVVRAGRSQPGEPLPLKSPEWLDPDPWVAKPMEASKLTEAVVETSMEASKLTEAVVETSMEAFMEASQPLVAESISSQPLVVEPMTSEHVTSESMSPEPMSPTPRMPEPSACQEQHRQHDDDAHPLLMGSHSLSLPCIMMSVLYETHLS
jgi:hypothetical protein